MMKILLSTLVLTSLFFSGCNEPKPCKPKLVQVKCKYPRLRTLRSVPAYEIKDFSVLDDRYYKVNKQELKMAAAVSQKKAKNLRFYERQIIKYNKEFTK